MRKLTLVLAALILVPFVLGASSCEQKIDGAYGINVTTNPDGTKSVTVDPAGGAIGSGLKVATDAGNSIPGPWTVILGVASLLLGSGGLAQTILLNRAKADAAAANKALGATVGGVASYAVANPTSAPALLAHIDAAHDAAGVPGNVQDVIQGAVSPV